MLVAGLISGTSVDGIDVALVEIEERGEGLRVAPKAFYTAPYPRGVRSAILRVSNAEAHTARISQLNFLIGGLFADAVAETCRRSGMDPRSVELIGSHGQTIYHQPEPETLCGRAVRSTLQIGEAAVIAERTGAPVVADFRPADMAAGGQGAPLVPYVDYLLYRDPERGRVALNIGGIANVTAIPPAAAPEQVLAFDTGPGNMVIDALVSLISRGTLKYDRDGRMAAAGRVDEELLKELLSEPYFSRRPPKSTGRELFGAEYVADLLERGGEPGDLVSTATELTAAAVAAALDQFVKPAMPVDELIVSGGGGRNPEILRRLAQRLPGVQLRRSDDYGIESDAKEAIAFAVLAYETYHRRPANLPSATGARMPCVLGKLAFPPVRSKTDGLPA